MGVQLRITGAAVALTLLAQAASAQDEPQGNKVILPPIDVSVHNLFDRQLVDYAVVFSPNFYSAYPLPGRTFMFKAAVKY